MSPSMTRPLSGSCKVASVRMRVDLPAPFGPSSPYMPAGMVRETLLSALTPFWYVFERFSIRSSMLMSSLLRPRGKHAAPPKANLAPASTNANAEWRGPHNTGGMGGGGAGGG